ncbi:MAG: NAD(P)/FAD-dependent oxidoreductase [Ilumatobacteraceae bacterium]
MAVHLNEPSIATRTRPYDVVVVGARCAGSATAMLLAAAGHDVLLLDRDTFPSDTLSTHAIARAGLVQLKRWGLLQAVLDTGAPPIQNVEFHGAGLSVARTVKERNGIDMLLAPRRHVLDMLLVNAAVSAGAQFKNGVTVDGVRRADDGRITGVRARTADGPVEIAARFVVGADGLKSRIARSVGAPLTELRGTGGAGHYAYYSGDWPAMEYYLDERLFAGVFPTNNGEACIWVCSPADDALHLRRNHDTPDAAFEAMLRATSPELFDRISTNATRTSPVRGMIGMPNQLRQPAGPGWALVGDAGYHRDAITGHGISDAFRDADLLATALDLVLRDDVDEATALSGYHAERDSQLREIFEITCALAKFPTAHRFIELQKQLSAATDNQAAVLAARPDPWLATA